MHTSLSGKLTRKTILALIFMATVYIPSYGEKSPPPSGTQCPTPCPTSCPAPCPNQNTCCLSPEAQIEAAHNEAARDAAAAKNTAIQTQAQIDAGQDASQHAADLEQKATEVFRRVFCFTGILLVLMLAVVAISLVWGKWSLRDALSEKSPVQPKEGAAVPLPSTSRFIALFGLLGTLTILLGVGYAIIWNLLIYHKPPENLSEIDSFLLGAASLFAPYIVNQLRAAFGTSPGERPTVPNAPSEKPPAKAVAANEHAVPADAPAVKH